MKSKIKKYTLITLIFIVFVGIYTGCSKKQYKFKEVSDTQIFSFLTNNITVLDKGQATSGNYAVPSEDWVMNVFTPKFKDYLFKYNIYYIY